MLENQLRRGIALAVAGKNVEARNVLSQVVRDDPGSASGWFWLASVVETQEQQRYCLEKTLQLDPQNQDAKQALAQLEPETGDETEFPQPRRAARPQHSKDVESFRKVIASVFPLESEFYYAGKSADKGLAGQPLLLDICQEILSTSFGIFDLSSASPNAYIEMGIALGLNQPMIATAREQTALPPVLKWRDVITYADHSDLEIKLSNLRDQGFPPATRSTGPDYCHFCHRVCDNMSTPPNENSYLVLNRSKLLWRGLMQSLTPRLAEYHLYPVYLTDRSSGPRLCDVRGKVLASQFVLCHLGELSDENSFLALGIAIGSRVPWILLSKKNHDSVPSNLQGVDRIEYATLADLESRLTETLRTFLDRIMPGLAVKSDKTSMLSLPFWMQLDDWIEHVSQSTQAREAIQGRVQVVQYKGQKHISKRIVPEKGLLFGRDPDCDVVIENQSVSSHHLHILKGRTGKYFVEDLCSKNGTFLNGTRLSPNRKIEINPNDTIRIPGARFLIWDNRPLPPEQTDQVAHDTDQLPPISRIEIPDVAPPAYLSTWDHPLTITALLPDGHRHSAFEVQAYYPMGRIISELVNLLDLPKQKYCFRLKNKLIGDDETPLSVGIKRGDVLIITPKGIEAIPQKPMSSG